MNQRQLKIEELWKLNGRADTIEEGNKKLGGCVDQFGLLEAEQQDIVRQMIPALLRQAQGDTQELIRLLRAHIEFFMPGGAYSDMRKPSEKKQTSDKRRIEKYVENKSSKESLIPKKEYIN